MGKKKQLTKEPSDMRYKDGKIYCWRRGDLTVTEHLNNFESEIRDSGQYGTGIYCYENLHPAISLPLGLEYKEPDLEEEFEKRTPLLQLDITDLKLFEPRNLNDLEKFSKALRKIVWHYRHMPENGSKARWIEKYHRLREDIKHQALSLIDNEPQLKDIIYNLDYAIQKTIECVDIDELSNCSQPINNVLDLSGFDGIKPFTDMANSGRWGILIFKESARKISCITGSPRFTKDKEKVANVCEIFPFKNDLEPFLEDERNDEYLQIADKILFTHKFDFHNRLTQQKRVKVTEEKYVTKEMTLDEKVAQINELYDHCQHWAIIVPELPQEEKKKRIQETKEQCKLLRDYYLKQVEKKPDAD